MNNAIKYYYDIDIDNISKENNYYLFNYLDELYYLVPFNRNIYEEKEIFELNKFLSEISLVHTIIPNKFNSIITYIENKQYLLYRININPKKKISLSEINYLVNIYTIDTNKKGNNIVWDKLWMIKIDNFEYQINQNGKKYPIVVDSFSYFVGLAENAISYLKDTLNNSIKDNSDIKVISHRRINDNIISLYDPINIIFDHKARDLGEYIKLSFFNNNKNIFKELDEYFTYNYYSIYGIRLLFSRIMYPSFYFDLYDDIVINNSDEKRLIDIINRVNEYEEYLNKIFIYLRKFYNIPSINWLEKKDINQ